VIVVAALPLLKVTVAYAVPLTRKVTVPVGATLDPAGADTTAVATIEVP
jgi:hypothetical protein